MVNTMTTSLAPVMVANTASDMATDKFTMHTTTDDPRPMETLDFYDKWSALTWLERGGQQTKSVLMLFSGVLLIFAFASRIIAKRGGSLIAVVENFLLYFVFIHTGAQLVMFIDSYTSYEWPAKDKSSELSCTEKSLTCIQTMLLLQGFALIFAWLKRNEYRGSDVMITRKTVPLLGSTFVFVIIWFASTDHTECPRNPTSLTVARFFQMSVLMGLYVVLPVVGFFRFRDGFPSSLEQERKAADKKYFDWALWGGYNTERILTSMVVVAMLVRSAMSLGFRLLYGGDWMFWGVGMFQFDLTFYGIFVIGSPIMALHKAWLIDHEGLMAQVHQRAPRRGLEEGLPEDDTDGDSKSSSIDGKLAALEKKLLDEVKTYDE